MAEHEIESLIRETAWEFVVRTHEELHVRQAAPLPARSSALDHHRREIGAAHFEDGVPLHEETGVEPHTAPRIEHTGRSEVINHRDQLSDDRTMEITLVDVWDPVWREIVVDRTEVILRGPRPLVDRPRMLGLGTRALSQHAVPLGTELLCVVAIDRIAVPIR
jgi:hypothetical protein